MDFRKEMFFLSTNMKAEVLKELSESTNKQGYSYLFASTSEGESKVHVRGDISDEDAMNVVLAIIRKLSERYGVELILRTIKDII
jgi:hypothetical protein